MFLWADVGCESSGTTEAGLDEVEEYVSSSCREIMELARPEGLQKMVINIGFRIDE